MNTNTTRCDIILDRLASQRSTIWAMTDNISDIIEDVSEEWIDNDRPRELNETHSAIIEIFKCLYRLRDIENMLTELGKQLSNNDATPSPPTKPSE